MFKLIKYNYFISKLYIMHDKIKKTIDLLKKKMIKNLIFINKIYEYK